MPVAPIQATVGQGRAAAAALVDALIPPTRVAAVTIPRAPTAEEAVTVVATPAHAEVQATPAAVEIPELQIREMEVTQETGATRELARFADTPGV
jgi:hypothetical protein